MKWLYTSDFKTDFNTTGPVYKRNLICASQYLDKLSACSQEETARYI